MGKIVLVACTNVGRYIIETFMNNPNIGAELVGVVNLTKKQGMSKANYDCYADLVIKYNFPIYYCNNINDEETIEFIKSLTPDLIIQSGWSQKFSETVLKLPKYGCIGEHPAPLPKGRGAACVNWAILTGEKVWGDSYFRMVEEYDKGEVYAQKEFEIQFYDTVFTVYEKVASIAQKILLKYAKEWSEGIFKPLSLNEDKATYYKRRKPSDGEIKTFDQEAEKLHNFIRAQTKPYPCAYILTGKEKLYLLETRFDVTIKTDEEPGKVFAEKSNGGVLVSCGKGTVLEIIRVQPENAPSMWAAEYFFCENRFKCYL